VSASERGLLVVSVTDGAVSLLGVRAVASLAGDAAYRAWGQRRLAYVSANQIRVLDPIDGTDRILYDLGERGKSLDYNLAWLGGADADLAYAVAWDEPDGGRAVELGVIDDSDRRSVRIVAREAGLVPTLPPAPPADPWPGFANLRILGRDARGRLIVIPVGGQEHFTALWAVDLRTGWREAAPLDVEAFAVALSADARWLAVVASGAIHIRELTADGATALVELPAQTHAGWPTWSPDGQRLAFLVHEGAEPALDVSPARALDVWEVQTGQARRVTSGLGAYPALLGWTADSRAVLVEAFDGQRGELQVSLVDVETGRRVPWPVPPGCSIVGWIGGAPDWR